MLTHEIILRKFDTVDISRREFLMFSVMSTHQIDYTMAAEYEVSAEPPITLPVMHESKRVALAVYDKGKYSFVLPDSIGILVDFLELKAVFIYGKTGKGWSRALHDEYDLLCIALEPATG